MSPDAFRTTELQAALISFYDGVLKVPGAGGRPEAKIIKRRFAGKLADDPPAAPAPPPAEVSTAASGAGDTSPEATPAAPAAGEAAAATEAPAAATPAGK